MFSLSLQQFPQKTMHQSIPIGQIYTIHILIIKLLSYSALRSVCFHFVQLYCIFISILMYFTYLASIQLNRNQDITHGTGQYYNNSCQVIKHAQNRQKSFHYIYTILILQETFLETLVSTQDQLEQNVMSSQIDVHPQSVNCYYNSCLLTLINRSTNIYFMIHAG